MPTKTHNTTLHQRVQRQLDMDIRLLYGLSVPAFIVVAFIVAFGVVGEWWLLPGVLLVLIVMTLIVVVGMMQVMGDRDD